MLPCFMVYVGVLDVYFAFIFFLFRYGLTSAFRWIGVPANLRRDHLQVVFLPAKLRPGSSFLATFLILIWDKH